MSHVFFKSELEGVATFWRIFRPDGITLGFTSHDRSLRFDGLLHRSAPGLLPSAIRRTASLELDSAEVRGALAHDTISAEDLAEGRYDGARIAIGVVDWETLHRAILYRGQMGAMSEEDGRFTAELRSAKADLQLDLVPRTSPTCRARFCGQECTLSASRFTHEARLVSMAAEENRATFAGGPSPGAMREGSLRWVDGPHAGIEMAVMAADESGLVLDKPLDQTLEAGTRALLREGCDHTLATCSARFGNAVNFRGEPFLPGNDMLARHPAAS